MHIENDQLKQILLKGNYVSPEDAERAEENARSHHTSFTDQLLTDGLITNDLLGQALAESFDVPYSDLNSASLPEEQIKLIPESMASTHRAVVFSQSSTGVVIATDNPHNHELLPELTELFPHKKIRITYSLPDDIDALFVHYQKPLETRFSKILEKKERIAPELLEEIFDDSLTYKASDIHFEPQIKEVIIRFRVDGVLHQAGRIPKEYYENILNRIKVKSGLRIDEHFSTQDGSLRYENNTATVDMRISIVPTVEGEKVVCRVLSAYVQGLSLPEIGLGSAHQEILRAAADKPFGMIVVSGPTGSGKTTTLYALLKLLNNPDTNITTIEDPVEYKVQGVNQIQVNAQTNLTFAKGLRSIVRQDPDIILVGEIRDQETAEIAVNAALTGHLLLSTFHANDAATVVPRLVDIGIEPFLLASTLEVIVAQRLVRKICDNCRHSVTVKHGHFRGSLKVCAPYFPDASTLLYKGKGCATCSNTGFRGRTAIFEFIMVTPALQDLIVHKPSSQDVWRLAREEDSLSLFEDGIEKVKNGVTTLEELLRVAEPPEGEEKKKKSDDDKDEEDES